MKAAALLETLNNNGVIPKYSSKVNVLCFCSSQRKVVTSTSHPIGVLFIEIGRSCCTYVLKMSERRWSGDSKSITVVCWRIRLMKVTVIPTPQSAMTQSTRCFTAAHSSVIMPALQHNLRSCSVQRQDPV